MRLMGKVEIRSKGRRGGGETTRRDRYRGIRREGEEVR